MRGGEVLLNVTVTQFCNERFRTLWSGLDGEGGSVISSFDVVAVCVTVIRKLWLVECGTVVRRPEGRCKNYFTYGSTFEKWVCVFQKNNRLQGGSNHHYESGCGCLTPVNITDTYPHAG